MVTGHLEERCICRRTGEKISSLDEYVDKRRNLQLEEATLLVRKYEEVYDKRPPKELLRNSSGYSNLVMLS